MTNEEIASELLTHFSEFSHFISLILGLIFGLIYWGKAFKK